MEGRNGRASLVADSFENNTKRMPIFMFLVFFINTKELGNVGMIKLSMQDDFTSNGLGSSGY